MFVSYLQAGVYLVSTSELSLVKRLLNLAVELSMGSVLTVSQQEDGDFCFSKFCDC